MFDYLNPEEISGITNHALERFVDLYFNDKAPAVVDAINSALEKTENLSLNENLWRDLTLHYFQLPQPYYLGSKEVFLYFYKHRQAIADFLATSVLDEAKLAEINQCALDPNKHILAICYSLSLTERYKAAGHLICVNTYQTLLNNCAKEMRGLYATQAYFHALMLQRLFRESKQVWIDLGWKTMFKENYGGPKHFVATVLSQVQLHMTKQEKKLAEQLFKRTYDYIKQ